MAHKSKCLHGVNVNPKSFLKLLLASRVGFVSNSVMSESSLYNVTVKVESFYLEAQSIPELRRYVFAYTVSIQNQGTKPAQLITRHWVITDANGKIEEVRGDGVVGEQPHLNPGEEYRYTSGAMLETPVGTMCGSYQMVSDDGVRFDAEIPAFMLAAPRMLH